jgi:signal transduction histidine kinase/HD-like signal output (HDOD) protein
MAVASPQFYKGLEKRDNLPSLPHILVKLMELSTDPGEEATRRITALIEKDPALCARILGIVKPRRAHQQGPTNIQEAVSSLGRETVYKAIFAACYDQAFDFNDKKNYRILKTLWIHALMCGTIARHLAEALSYPHPDVAYLSGLLHDIGKWVLWVNFPDQYGAILDSSGDRADMLLTKESRLGTTHGEVGAWLIKRWNIHPFIADAALYHHERIDRIQSALPLVKIVTVANRLCPEQPESEESKEEMTKEILGSIGVETKAIMEQAAHEVHEFALSLGLDLPVDLQDLGPPTESDLKKREDLLSEIKAVSLFQGTFPTLFTAYGEDAILRSIKEGLRILHGISNVLFFLYDPNKDSLVYHPFCRESEKDFIPDMEIPYQTGESLVVRALVERKWLDSFSLAEKNFATIIDEQIIRMMDEEGMACLPMYIDDEPMGVIVLGMDDVQFSSISKIMNRLTLFSRQAATALQAGRERTKEEKPAAAGAPPPPSVQVRKVVHEVNTPLNIIKNYLAILGAKLAEKGPVQDELRIIKEEVDRVSLILRKLTERNNGDVIPKESIDINTFMSDITTMFRQTVLKDAPIEIHLNLDRSIPPLITDKNRLKQVFINLIKNATEAMPNGGNIHIGVRYIFNKEKEAQVEVTIRDDGPGIPDHIRSQLFRPFLTSKGNGHAGLGLTIVNNIIKELKGTVTCESISNVGTTFQIMLPIRL